MTEKAMRIKKRPSFSVIFLTVFAIFLFGLFLKNSNVASSYIKKGISVCMNSLIPSLFPYLVLSDILLSLSFQSIFEKPFKKIMRLFFGISGSGACAFILGILCGFPLGAKCAVELYSKGEISRDECERLLAFCNIPSLAFTVGMVGNIFKSPVVGLGFWGACVLCAALGGISNKLLLGESISKAAVARPMPKNGSRKSSGSIFVRAIERSARSTLLICAYVVFFSALTGSISFLLEGIFLPQELRSLLFGFFELTGGIESTARISSLKAKSALCGFFLGWSGLSVHLQIFSICDGKDLKFTNYLIQKLFQGMLCAFICAFLFG